jgi:isoleucyl-tRNA synthetase
MEFPEYDTERWEFILNLRDDVNKVLESARNDKLVGASLDAAAVIYAPDKKARKILDSVDGDGNLVYPPVKSNGVDDLRTTLMLSQVELVDSIGDVTSACNEQYVTTSDTVSGCVVGVKKASGKKCGRCWFYDDQVGKLGLPHGDICQRCNEAIFSWEKETGVKFEKPEPEPAAEPVA